MILSENRIDVSGSCPKNRPTRPHGRLTRRAEFLAAGGGRRFRTPRMTVMAVQRATQDGQGVRIGFTVTRKTGHATERNRIRRRLRAAAAAAARAWPPANLDVVVVARREAIGAEFAELVNDLTRALASLLQGGGKAPHQARTHSHER
jgi:ribonuclease P protein component